MVLICFHQLDLQYSKLKSKNQKLTDNYHAIFFVVSLMVVG